ncbi:hypothetical protein EVAR_49479_1 [Eumeta japonica]|uniref:Uncharacterized protein n=1 Tax=Eumeta variegata TaxID=151549 RepID=A0A4C1VW26_EUMVA|nr:hypothetical protein EVAR_49479_1 [Eumeta japonica]
MERKTISFILTNNIDPTRTGIVTRRVGNGERKETNCPEAVIQYNTSIDYVDKFDQLKSTYDVDRKTQLQKNHHPDLDQLSTKEFRRSVYYWILTPVQAKNFNLGSKRSLSASSSQLPVQIKRHKPSVPRELRLESSMHQPEPPTSRSVTRSVTCPVYEIYAQRPGGFTLATPTRTEKVQLLGAAIAA